MKNHSRQAMKNWKLHLVSVLGVLALMGVIMLLHAPAGEAQSPSVNARVAALESTVATLHTSLTTLQNQVGTLQTQVATLQTGLASEVSRATAAESALQSGVSAEAARATVAEDALSNRANALEQKTQYISVFNAEMFITGANLHLRSGLGATTATRAIRVPGTPPPSTARATS